MATYYSNIYHGAEIRNRCEAGEGLVTIRGRLEIPVNKAPATGDTLKFFILPSGATLLRIFFSNNDWGTTVPLDTIGTESDATAIATTDLALGTARGITTLPIGYYNDLAGTSTSLVTTFYADLPPAASDEDVYGVLGSVTAGSTSGCWISFTAEILIPDARTTFGGGTQYTWNGTSAGLGNAST